MSVDVLASGYGAISGDHLKGREDSSNEEVRRNSQAIPASHIRQKVGILVGAYRSLA